MPKQEFHIGGNYESIVSGNRWYCAFIDGDKIVFEYKDKYGYYWPAVFPRIHAERNFIYTGYDGKENIDK